MEAYRNTSLSPQRRAEALLARMSVREKVGQLNQRLYGFGIYTRNGSEFTLTEEFKDEVGQFGGLGVLYGLYRSDPWAGTDELNGIIPELSKKAYNMVQEYVISHSRFQIPMLLSSECPHGHQALGGGLLPVNLAAGASFDPTLLERAYRACGKQLSSGHVDLALMSVLDVLRDPRWGRSEECYSEDPYLSAKMAFAAVSGMQSAGVSCVAKHFCAQGETTGGVNASAARIGERELREIHFPPAKAACKAGAEGIMAAYNEIDGIYCHSNSWLLRKVLREEMGFRGVVMADGLAIDQLKTAEGDLLHAAAAALSAGIDISLWDDAYAGLEEAVKKGLVEEQLLDEAVLRVLKLKFQRGLFEAPYMKENMISAAGAGINELSLKLAEESVVLLKNDSIFVAEDKSIPLLPLNENLKKIAVIGWHAFDRYSQLGDYTPPVSPEDCVTLAEGVRSFAPEGAEILCEAGCGFDEITEEAQDKALLLAEWCDVMIFAAGGSSSRFKGALFDRNGAAVGGSFMDCGEGMDSAGLCIPKAQEELLLELRKKGKPIVTVLTAGRPYCMEIISKNSNALLCSFYPGPFGGAAIAKLLYGIAAPSGRLPVSIPRHPGQLPVYYNAKASAKRAYADMTEEPLYTFGDGMSYTEFSYEDISAEAEGPEGMKLHVKFCIRNTGECAGTAVPQLYLRRFSGGTVPRVKELKGFRRVFLKPGECVKTEIVLGREELEMTGSLVGPEKIRGRIRLMLCDSGIQFWSCDWHFKNQNEQ